MKKHLFFLFTLMLSLTIACRFGSIDRGIQFPGEKKGVPLPPKEDYGIFCFLELEDRIVASAPVFDSFSTQDGGLTWQAGLMPEGGGFGANCSQNKNPRPELWVTPDGQTRYRFKPGESIEISTDKGLTWEEAYDLTQVQWEPADPPLDKDREIIVQPGPLDAMIDPQSGNLLLAMGHAGVLLHLPSGDWRWVRVGQYANEAGLTGSDEAVPEEMPEDIQPPVYKQVSPEIKIDTQTNYVDALAFSPDGAVLAVSGFSGGVKLYDFKQADLLYWHTFGGENRYWRLYGMVYSPVGDTLVTCGTNVDQTLAIWDAESWTLIKSYEGFQTRLLTTSMYAGRQFLAVAYGTDPQNKDQVRLFQLPQGDELNTFSSQSGSVSSLFSIPETLLLIVNRVSGLLEVWDIHKGDHRTFPETYAMALGYNPSVESLMGFRPDGMLTAWDMSTVNLTWELALHIPHGWRVNTATFSQDGRLVAVGMHNGPLLVFDSRTGETLTHQWITDGGTLQQLAFSPDDQWLAAGFTTGEVRIWQVETLIQQD